MRVLRDVARVAYLVARSLAWIVAVLAGPGALGRRAVRVGLWRAFARLMR